MTADRRSSRARLWLKDESMLALDLYFREGPNAPRASTDDLSRVLRAFPIEAELAVNPGFRSEASVRQKLGNFTWIDPNASGGLRNASTVDVAVWEEFKADRERLRTLAERIRRTVLGGETIETELPEGDDEEADEGSVLTRLHRSRERSRRLVARKKQQALAATGRLTCEACGFEFDHVYGDLGSGFIECHHRVPVSELTPGTRTRLSDLALVCANCHRMIHRRRPWLTVEELATIVAPGTVAHRT
jgi:5-methylcytosine-specific restriction enzyme A